MALHIPAGGLYVLNLEHGCKYVGSTHNFTRRLREHADGYSSAWVSLHKMQNVYAIYPMETKDDKILRFAEEELTFDMMQKFGIDNVRGAAFCAMDFKDDERQALLKLLSHRSDRCLLCAQEGHYVNNCPNSKSSTKFDGFWGWVQKGIQVAREQQKVVESQPSGMQKTSTCRRCGRRGHWVKSCFATTHLNGARL
jgi:predicted GIY-YIG superfamily endonuclease